MTKKGKSRRGHGQTTNQKKSQRQSSSQIKEDVERKRDERSRRNTSKKRRVEKELYCTDDGDFKSFDFQLRSQGFEMKDVVGDGNCLFRAFADQVNDDEKMHKKHRQDVVEYMRKNKDDFAPFLDETVTFEKHLKNLASSGTYGGNDSIVAFARHNKVDVIIHQFNNPTFVINGGEARDEEKTIHLAYHSYLHYSSVKKLDVQDYQIENDNKKIGRNKEKENMNSDSNSNDKNNNNESIKGNIDHNNESNIQSSNRSESSSVSKKDMDDSLIQETVRRLQKTLAYKDSGEIRKCLVENQFNEDETLSYIMQIMNLDEKDLSLTLDERPGVIESDDENFSPFLLDHNAALSDCHDDDGELTLDLISVTKDDRSQVEDACSSNGVNDTSSSETLNCSCSEENKVKSKVTKVDVRKKLETKTKQRPLSNRQGKELAKQARKKRREETKKDDAIMVHSPPLVVKTNAPSCINI